MQKLRKKSQMIYVAGVTVNCAEMRATSDLWLANLLPKLFWSFFFDLGINCSPQVFRAVFFFV